jgi:hypothetical protein
MYHAAPSLEPSVVEALASLTPRGDNVAWLHASWRPDWERWCIYQMTPAGHAPSMVWGPETPLVMRAENILGKRMLRLAPDPRFKQLLNPAMMTRHAWRLHLETGAYPQPFWVVQGRTGGHKWDYSAEESRLLQLHGHSGEAPEPGTLPYAPIDNRVLNQLRPVAYLRLWNTLSKGLHEMDARELDAHEADLMREGNRQLWKWLQRQADEVFDDATGSERGAGYRDSDANYEEIEQEFVENVE